jgi:hypothetical protein
MNNNEFSIDYAECNIVRQQYIKSRLSSSTGKVIDGETVFGCIDFDKFERFYKLLKSLKKENKINSVRIYLFREKRNNQKIYRADQASILNFPRGDDLSQMSFLILPTVNVCHKNGTTKKATKFFEDDYVEDGKTYALRPGGEVTGLCPPKCGQ